MPGTQVAKEETIRALCVLSREHSLTDVRQRVRYMQLEEGRYLHYN